MRNKFSGRCETCNCFVAANAGEAIRTTTGRWVVRCEGHGTSINPVAAAAQAVLALVIKIWLEGGKVFCQPVSRLERAQFDN
jgi:hypothetical protein